MRTALMALLLLAGLVMRAQDCPRSCVAPGEFGQRREALLNRMDSLSVFVLRAAGEQFEDYTPYRQDPDFLYLTGIPDAGYYALLTPRGILFGNVRKYCIIFYGGNKSESDLYLSSKDTLLPAREFQDMLGKALTGASTLFYTPVPELSHDWVNGKVFMAEREMKKEFTAKHPGIALKPGARMIASQRMIKSQDEIRCTREAIRITKDGILGSMKACRPGMPEYALQAILESEATRQGSQGMAFYCIIGSGVNSLEPHYNRNDAVMKEGDLVVMDVGARCGGYCADITRTFPVTGKFTPDQAAVYNTVLDIQEKLISQVKPGTTSSEIDRIAFRLTQEAGYGRYYLHGVTHPVGLAVHDVSSTDSLKPGMIVTIEPGIYIPADDTIQPAGRRGFGIRIEDDVLVTDKGYEVLSSEIPKEIAEIEKLMKR